MSDSGVRLQLGLELELGPLELEQRLLDADGCGSKGEEARGSESGDPGSQVRVQSTGCRVQGSGFGVSGSGSGSGTLVLKSGRVWFAGHVSGSRSRVQVVLHGCLRLASIQGRG